MVTNVTNQIHTLLLADSAVGGIILPGKVFEPSSPNAMDILVNLHNLLVIPSAKLWTVYPNDPAVIISNALKCEGGIACLTLRAIVV